MNTGLTRPYDRLMTVSLFLAAEARSDAEKHLSVTEFFRWTSDTEDRP
jgi:hypothetical protein